jgi:hypothetical protein
MEHNLGNTPVQEERPGRMLIRRPPLVLLQAPVCRRATGHVSARSDSPPPGSCGDRNTPSPEVLLMRFSYCMVPEVYQLL